MKRIFYITIAFIIQFNGTFMFSQNFNINSLELGYGKDRTSSISSGDIDNDGDIDLIIANGRHWPGQNKILLNNGIGRFTVEKDLGSDRMTSYAAELGDLNGDGYIDVAVGNDKAPNNIFINDGLGNFKLNGSFGRENSNTRNIKLDDIDNDGDIDILITNRFESNEI